MTDMAEYLEWRESQAANLSPSHTHQLTNAYRSLQGAKRSISFFDRPLPHTFDRPSNPLLRLHTASDGVQGGALPAKNKGKDG
ncbi:hypothetical protein BSNK01_22930 [Bacillaceae bacterium]